MRISDWSSDVCSSDLGVEVFKSTVALIRRLRDRGIKTALVSSSRNARAVLETVGIEGLFDVCIDGNDADGIGLKGKLRPDIFLAAAERLGADRTSTRLTSSHSCAYRSQSSVCKKKIS